MRRLLAAAAIAAAFAAPAPATATHYDRTCGGALDYQCNGTVCPMDCFPGHCLVWIDPLHSPFSALCVSSIGPLA